MNELKAAINNELSTFLLVNERPERVVINVCYGDTTARLCFDDEVLDKIYGGGDRCGNG